MPITALQTAAALEIIAAILTATVSKGKRQLAGMFLELVDRRGWPQYYEIIPEPRCLNNIKASIEKGRYKDALDIYTDISLVFWNALFYNEADSQIAQDAQTLKTLFETEWKKRSVLPVPRSTSPPPSSPQKVHKVEVPAPSTETQPTPSTVSPSTSRPPAPAAPTVTQHPAPPVASGSNSNLPKASSSTKPVAIRPKALPPAAENEEDSTPEPDVLADASSTGERDQASDEIVRQLEKGLPRWPGFGEEGWLDDVRPERIAEVVNAMKTYKDANGLRPAAAVEAVPEEASLPYLSHSSALSLRHIETRARHKTYSTSKEFELDMARLFEKCRRWHKPGSESYGHVLIIQRFYQSLMSSHRSISPPYKTNTHFAALRAGPGNVKPLSGNEEDELLGVTTHRIPTHDRTFVEELHYTGWSLKPADWVHLSNPDDPSRPIVGEIFKCWISDEPLRKGQSGITVSWYYRPEQTFHPSGRMFWEGEVFKTGHYGDHPVEDVIEKVACQFTVRHIRGRPRPPFWYLGFPLYVCESRYNDQEKVFVKIKNWNACLPEEVKDNADFMPVYPFERTVFPARLQSPFVGKNALKSTQVGKGFGGLLGGDTSEQQQTTADTLASAAAGPSQSNLRSRKQEDASNKQVTKGYAAIGGSALSGTNTAAVLAQFGYHHTSMAYQPVPSGQDRSVVTASWGMAALGQGAQVEKLPAETVKHFDRDAETNQVLWFSAPPVNMARPTKPKYSMAYLHFLAMKRKRETEMEMEMERDESVDKRVRRMDRVPMTTEDLGVGD